MYYRVGPLGYGSSSARLKRGVNNVSWPPMLFIDFIYLTSIFNHVTNVTHICHACSHYSSRFALWVGIKAIKYYDGCIAKYVTNS